MSKQNKALQELIEVSNEVYQDLGHFLDFEMGVKIDNTELGKRFNKAMEKVEKANK